MIDEIVRAVLTGVVSAFVLVYGFDNKKPYPAWMLVHYRHPWLWFVLAAVAMILFMYDYTLFVLFLLMIASIHLDMMVFGKPQPSDDPTIEAADDLFNDDRVIYDSPLSALTL